MSRVLLHPPDQNGHCVYIAELFIECLFHARAFVVVIVMKETAPLFANFATGRIPRQQVAASVAGHILLLLIDLKQFSNMQ